MFLKYFPIRGFHFILSLLVLVPNRHVHCFSYSIRPGFMFSVSSFSPFFPMTFSPSDPFNILGLLFPGIPLFSFVHFKLLYPLNPLKPLGPLFPRITILPLFPSFHSLIFLPSSLWIPHNSGGSFPMANPMALHKLRFPSIPWGTISSGNSW